MAPTCFVIQPFDAGKFDKRFDDIYEPALQEANLEPYRVDRDPSVDVPITAIEEGISKAAICLADITTDNQNVWYELGFAFAAKRPVIMICSSERKGAFSFDIQHRKIIICTSESSSDFDNLRHNISERATALVTSDLLIRQAAETDQVAPEYGLSPQEIMVLTVLAGNTGYTQSGISTQLLEHAADRAGLTPVGFGLGFRRLLSKNL